MAKKAIKLAARYRIESGRGFSLSQHEPGDTGGIKSKLVAERRLARTLAELSELQERLYAQDRWALLVIFQALDAAGKDSTIKRVMSGVNPTGCHVVSFKEPSREELDHDWMWRCYRQLPERGRIGIFNRSYYEEVLVARVHPEVLAAQKLPSRLLGKSLWKERFEDINAFERHLTRNGVAVIKFFLNVSKEVQKERFLARIDDERKNWKFETGDVDERGHWDAYQKAYGEAIAATSTPHAPWHVVPADKKWFTRLVVAETMVATLAGLELAYPIVSKEQAAELGAARERLVSE
jgi:PPK2 family polyphosphate:nucleotide phosphotransferase